MKKGIGLEFFFFILIWIALFRFQVGVVQYGSTVVHEFSLGEYQTVDTVVEAVRNIDQRGGYETRTALAINVARYVMNTMWSTLELCKRQFSGSAKNLPT